MNEKVYKRLKETLSSRIGDYLCLSLLGDMQEDLAKEVVFRESANLALRIRQVDEKLRKLKSDYEKSRLELSRELEDLRQSCKHPVTEYHPDASGNNDSSTQCLACGKYM